MLRRAREAALVAAVHVLPYGSLAVLSLLSVIPSVQGWFAAQSSSRALTPIDIAKLWPSLLLMAPTSIC